jgi:alpha-mannosidase
MMRTIHVVSHTHWDREWYQTFQQFRLKLVALVDGLLELLEADPGFRHFMLDGQTIVLDDYLAMRPEREATLRDLVQRGRLLIGPWHILPDMFLVSPEAHIRNLLQGARTARHFGPKMMVGYIPDPFGHPGQVPQILRGFNITAAALWRGVDDQPCEFWWQSPDGSRVLMAFLRDSYGNGASLPADDPPRFTAQLVQAAASLAAHSAAQDVLIMYGTDHMAPSAHSASAIAYARAHLPEARVLHSTLPAYLEAVARQVPAGGLPSVRGELRACSRAPLLPGVLSTRMWIKQRNRACETLLESWAEPFSVFAARLALPPPPTHLVNPAPLLRQAWRLLMENHPHDSICGCSIDQVHAEMQPRFDQVEQIGEEITRQSLLALAGQVDTRRDGAATSVLVFNPSGAARSEPVEVALHLPETIRAFEIFDTDGQILPHASLGAHSAEFANLVLQKHELFEMLGNIHDGRVAGMAIQHIEMAREGALLRVEAVLDEHLSPNLAAWQAAQAQIEAVRSDTGIEQVQVRARTSQAARVVFLARQVPAHGWRAFWVRGVDSPTAQPARINPLITRLAPLAMRFASSRLGERLLPRLTSSRSSRPPYRVENEHFQVEVSPVDGTLTISDRRTGAVLRGMNRFVSGGDAGDEYNYAPPSADALVTARLVSVRVFADALLPVLEIHLRLRAPARLDADRQRRAAGWVDLPIVSRVSLPPGTARIEIHTQVDNQAEDHRLRVHFPAPLQVSSAAYDGHFEVVQRPLGAPARGEGWVEEPRPEAPQRTFCDISDGRVGLMIANRGLPEVEVLRTPAGTEIALTLLRCVGWLSRADLAVRLGHAGPGLATPGAQMTGRWGFDYAILPHAGDWHQACLQAYAFAAPLRALSLAPCAGALPPAGAFITHEPPEFVITAVKESEEAPLAGRGWIVRGVNLGDQPLTVALKPALAVKRAWRANLAEEPLEALPIEEDGRVRFSVRAHEIATVRFV